VKSKRERNNGKPEEVESQAQECPVLSTIPRILGFATLHDASVGLARGTQLQNEIADSGNIAGKLGGMLSQFEQESLRKIKSWAH